MHWVLFFVMLLPCPYVETWQMTPSYCAPQVKLEHRVFDTAGEANAEAVRLGLPTYAILHTDQQGIRIGSASVVPTQEIVPLVPLPTPVP